MKTQIFKLGDPVFCAALLIALNSAFAQADVPLLTTITHPTPASGDIFGESVTAVGTDRVPIGSEAAAEAYLFSLDARLLTTFTNPEAPGGTGFSYSLAAVGNDRVVIGNYNYFTGLTQVGRAYLFSAMARCSPHLPIHLPQECKGLAGRFGDLRATASWLTD